MRRAAAFASSNRQPSGLSTGSRGKSFGRPPMTAQQAAGGMDSGSEMTFSEVEVHHPTGPAGSGIAIDGGAPFRGHAARETAPEDWLARPAVVIGMMVAVVILILAVV